MRFWQWAGVHVLLAVSFLCLSSMWGCDQGSHKPFDTNRSVTGTSRRIAVAKGETKEAILTRLQQLCPGAVVHSPLYVGKRPETYWIITAGAPTDYRQHILVALDENGIAMAFGTLQRVKRIGREVDKRWAVVPERGLALYWEGDKIPFVELLTFGSSRVLWQQGCGVVTSRDWVPGNSLVVLMTSNGGLTGGMETVEGIYCLDIGAKAATMTAEGVALVYDEVGN